MDDQVVRLVGPFVPAVGVVPNAGGFVGGDPETVDSPLQGCSTVDRVQVGLVGDPLNTASTVHVQHTSVVDQFPVAVPGPVPADPAVDAVEAGVPALLFELPPAAQRLQVVAPT